MGTKLKQSRLVGDTSIYKPLSDRDRLRDPNDGVEYFKNELRTHFVQGVEAVFIFRFYQLQKVLQRLTIPPEIYWNITSPPEAHH